MSKYGNGIETVQQGVGIMLDDYNSVKTYSLRKDKSLYIRVNQIVIDAIMELQPKLLRYGHQMYSQSDVVTKAILKLYKDEILSK